MTRYIYILHNTYVFSVYIFKYIHMMSDMTIVCIILYSIHYIYNTRVCACLIAHWFVSCFPVQEIFTSDDRQTPLRLIAGIAEASL